MFYQVTLRSCLQSTLCTVQGSGGGVGNSAGWIRDAGDEGNADNPHDMRTLI